MDVRQGKIQTQKLVKRRVQGAIATQLCFKGGLDYKRRPRRNDSASARSADFGNRHRRLATVRDLSFL